MASVWEDEDADTVDSWTPLQKRLRPQFDAVLQELPEDSGREFDMDDITKFFTMLAEDCGPTEIGLSLGWSPAMIKRFVSDPDRAELMQAVGEAQNESVERAILRTSRSGNVTAQKLWVYNKAAHRGWADRRQIKVEARSQQEIVVSVRQVMDEKIRQLTGESGEAGIAALQAAMFEPDMPDFDDDITDAELVEVLGGDSDLYR